jgi:hypothetical protein
LTKNEQNIGIEPYGDTDNQSANPSRLISQKTYDERDLHKLF